jgi:flagellar L-ring protein precursor FlgH
MADDLYRQGNWPAMGSDRKASAVGDTITVVVYQSVESSNVEQNSSRRSTDLGGSVRAGSVSEGGELSLGGGFSGRGEARRSERLVAQLSVSIHSVLPNGDYLIVGRQQLRINGERTDIGVRGRIRPEDITGDNQVLSNRIADAEIDYNGKGFVSRSAKPGLINRVFSMLGLG